MKKELIIRSLLNLCIVLLFIGIGVLFVPKALALTQCAAEGGTCVDATTCKAACNYCASTDFSGNDMQCGSGSTCCDPSGIQPVCNSGWVCPDWSGAGQPGQYCSYTEYNSSSNVNCDYQNFASCQPSGGTCVSNGVLPSGYHWWTSSDGPKYGWFCSSKITCAIPNPACTSGVSCGACGNLSQPTNTCGTTSGSTSCSYTAPQPCNSRSAGTQACTASYNNCSTGYTCPTGAGFQQACVTHINVHVYKDYNHDGVVNGADGGYQGISVTDGSGAQTTDSTGYTIFTGETTGTYTITITVPTNWHVLGSNPSQTVTLTTSNGNVNLAFYLTPLYSISGNLFNDNNHNTNYDTGDTLYTGSTTVHITGVSPVTDMTQTDGTYATPTSLESGNYTVTLSSSLPTGYSTTTTKTWNVTVGATGTSPACAIGGSPDAACGGTNNGSISGLNFGINPPYQISGYVYNDVNKDSKYEAGNPDTPFTGGPTVKIVGPSTNPTTTTVTANTTTGLYSSGQVLLPGQYTVSYTSALPGGYKFQTLSSYVVTVGYNPACNASSSNDGTCGDPNGGSVNNLNFGLTNEISWPQPICTDVRIDGGYNEQIPSTADCNGTAAPYAIMNSSNICPNVPGILFSGNTDPQYGLGTGASTSNIVVGNSLFPEIFNFRIPTVSSASYSFTKTTSNNLLTPSVSLTSICPNLTTCTLSKLTPGGVYTTTAADGPVSISVSNTDGSFDLGQKNYSFMIAGDLTFKTKINVQDGYSAAFVSGGDIHVDGSVGETDWTSLTPDLEGFFSADKSFYIDSLYTAGQQCLATGQPKEKKLNIKGSVAVNGAGAGGSVVNNRDGCVQDLSCPTVTYTIDPAQILNPPSVLKPPYTFWQELNP